MEILQRFQLRSFVRSYYNKIVLFYFVESVLLIKNKKVNQFYNIHLPKRKMRICVVYIPIQSRRSAFQIVTDIRHLENYTFSHRRCEK